MFSMPVGADVIARSTASGSIHQESGKTSTNTGVAPRYVIGAADAIQFVSARMTSSPGPTPIAARPICIAPVQLDVAIAYCAPVNSLNLSSNF